MTFEELKRAAAGKLGKAIDKTMGWAGPNQSFANNKWIDLSATLQNYGGNKSGSFLSSIVKPKQAYAADMPETNYEVKDTAYPKIDPNIGDDSYRSSSGNTGGGSGNGSNNASTPPPTDDTNSDEYQMWKAEEERKAEARRQNIIGKLNLIRDKARQQKGMAADKYNFVTGEVNKNYDALGGILKDKLSNSLAGLTQEDIGVQNDYGKLAGNVRRAMESALTRNRLLHRAQGSLGSSFYTDAQGDTTNKGMTGMNDVGFEEADKRAAIKGRISDTNTFFQQKGLELETEKTGLLQQALREKQDADADADLMEKEYGLDSEEQLAQNEYEFNSALGRIQDYIQNKSQKLAEIAAYNKTNGAVAGAVNSFAWRDPIAEKLDTTTGKQSGLNAVSALATAGSKAYPMSSGGETVWIDRYGNRVKKQPEDVSGYYINSPYVS